MGFMIGTARSQQTYDHRLKALVYSTGDIHVALAEGVPRSTARGWLRSPPREVVSSAELELIKQRCGRRSWPVWCKKSNDG